MLLEALIFVNVISGARFGEVTGLSVSDVHNNRNGMIERNVCGFFIVTSHSITVIDMHEQQKSTGESEV